MGGAAVGSRGALPAAVGGVVAAAAALGPWPYQDWHMFEESAARGLDAYAFAGDGYANALTGPLTLTLAAVLPYAAAVVLILALLPWTLYRQRASLSVAVAVAIPWGGLAAWGHADDALAVALLLEARLHRGWLRGLLIGLAVLAKPWAVLGVPFLWRDRQATVTAAVTQLVWLPFLPDLLGIDNPSVVVQPDSVMRLYLGFGYLSGPGWRLAELAVMVAVVVLCIRRGRADAAIAAALAARTFIDPGGYDYYSAGMLLAIVPMRRGRTVALVAALAQWLLYQAQLWSPGSAAVLGLLSGVVLVMCLRRPEALRRRVEVGRPVEAGERGLSHQRD